MHMSFRLALILIFTTTFSHARSLDRKVLKCLGEEEKRFHLKKESGPFYDLNQRLISELIQIPRVEITHEDYLTACTGENKSEAWKLLELSLKKGRDLFVIPKDVQGMQRGITESMIEDFLNGSKDLLLNFVAQIQTLSPTPTCLQEEIPELDAFFTEIKYLEEDVDVKLLFQGKDQRILDRVKSYPLAFEKCRARLKKKTKSVSVEDPKKS